MKGQALADFISKYLLPSTEHHSDLDDKEDVTLILMGLLVNMGAIQR